MELPIQVAARIYNPLRQKAEANDQNVNPITPATAVDDDKNVDTGTKSATKNFVYTVPAVAAPDPQRQFDNFMTGGLVEVGQHSFPVTYALPLNHTQSQLYYQAVFPLINLFLEGFDASIVTYGQKGTGKTYVLYGSESDDLNSEAEQGIVQRSVREVFAHIANNGDRTHAVSIGWVEICGDSIRDLLGVGNVHCKNTAEVFHWLQLGYGTRASQNNIDTKLATHTLFTITLEQQWVSKEGLIQHRLSTASFSDLASSDRVLVLNALDQAAHIPKEMGLRALEQIVATLTDPALMYSVNGNIPYNQTALTTLLKDSFGGRAQTLVLLCLSPLEIDASETIANLQFAFKMQCVRNFVVMNTFSDNNTPVVPRDIMGQEMPMGMLPGTVNDNFGLQFAASQWSKLVSNAEGLFSKLMVNNAISQLEKEQIEEWLFLKQECEECLSSNEVLRSQKQLRPIQEAEEPEEVLSEPEMSCQQNSDNDSDAESHADLNEKLEWLMEELQVKTDTLVKNKYQDFMERQPKPVMESQDSLLLQKRECATQIEEKASEVEERKASVGGRRRSIQPGASLSSAELVMLNRVASREQASSGAAAAAAKTSPNHVDFLDSVDLQTNAVLPLRTTHNSPIEVLQKKLRKLNSDIEARLRQIKEVEETMQLKQNIITELVKNSETRSNAKQRFNKKKSKLEAEYEKAKKQLDKAILHGKEKTEIERLRGLIEHLEQRLKDLISIKHIAADSGQKVKKLQQSLHDSKKLLEDLQKKVKKERKLQDQLEGELKSLKEKENENDGNNLDDSTGQGNNDNKQLKEVQARISHLDHVLREKSQAAATGNAQEGLRHEIRNLRRTRDYLLEQRCSLDRKLKRDKILSYREERKLLECDEAIEAIDAAIEFKNELICGHKSIDTSERLQREKGEQMLMARLNKLSPEEMRTLLYKYFTKVIDLRDSSRKLEVQLMQLERDRDAWEWKERALSNAVRQARLEGERNAVLLQRQHEMKLTLMLRHLADETSLSSSSYSDNHHFRPGVTPPTHRYLNHPGNFSLTPSGTDSDFDLDFYKNSLHSKMLMKPPKHGEIEICPNLPDALTKYKPLDKLKDKERESKNKLLAKFQVLTRYAGQSMLQNTAAAAATSAAQTHSHTHIHADVENGNTHDDNGNALHLAAFGAETMTNAAAITAAAAGGNNNSTSKKKKDKNHKESHAAAAAIPQENLKRLISTPPATKVTRQKNKIIIQDASRRN